VESAAETSSGGQKSADWSKRLLNVAKKRKQEKKGPTADIFTPAPKKTDPNYYEGSEEGELGLDDGQVAGPKRLPAEMRCFDTARIYIRSGDGGNGCVAFRREKFVEHGGPAGGNGGRGGNVWAVADPQLNSLFSFRTQVHWRATSGVNGEGGNCDGADAADLYIPVPCGTIVRRKDAGEDEPPLAELLQEGEKALLMVGGRGGRGNASFKTARNNAPAFAERGEEGLEAWLDLELKVVADCGIIGVPNAGKSTLLSVLSAARPKIASYPFTTLVPNLGVCESDYRTTVFADVPGLLEGAHEGLGLGHEFLRHVSRCRALVHVIDGTSPDPLGDYDAINLELELFSPALKGKPQVVAYNKMDVPESAEFWEDVREGLVARGADAAHCYAISAATGRGVQELVRGVRALLDALGPAEVVRETDAVNATRLPARKDTRIDDYTVTVEEVAGESSPLGGPARVFYVDGEGLEKFAQMTNWNYWDAVRRFARVLEVSGVNAALLARGVREGDSVVIGGTEFEWRDDRSEGALYDAWEADMRARGANRQGVARWPSAFRPRN